MSLNEFRKQYPTLWTIVATPHVEDGHGCIYSEHRLGFYTTQEAAATDVPAETTTDKNNSRYKWSYRVEPLETSTVKDYVLRYHLDKMNVSPIKLPY